MNGTEYVLANLWIGLFAFFLLFYAITDGADLGLGMLSLICRSHKERDIMIGAITSTWHTNQTWLVVLGEMVFGAFPFFYGFVFIRPLHSRHGHALFTHHSRRGAGLSRARQA